MSKTNLILWVRSQVGLARVMHGFDSIAAKSLGIQVLNRFCDSVIELPSENNADIHAISPYISNDPPLLKTYLHCLEIKKKYDALQNSIEQFRNESFVRICNFKEIERQLQDELEATTPSAQEILKLIEDGSRFELNGHSIEFDQMRGKPCRFRAGSRARVLNLFQYVSTLNNSCTFNQYATIASI